MSASADISAMAMLPWRRDSALLAPDVVDAAAI